MTGSNQSVNKQMVDADWTLARYYCTLKQEYSKLVRKQLSSALF